jgi:hypothetical protein
LLAKTTGIVEVVRSLQPATLREPPSAVTFVGDTQQHFRVAGLEVSDELSPCSIGRAMLRKKSVNQTEGVSAAT